MYISILSDYPCLEVERGVRRPPGRAPDDDVHACVECVLSTGLLRYARVLASCVPSRVVYVVHPMCCVLVVGGERCMNGASPGGLVSFVFFISPSCA